MAIIEASADIAEAYSPPRVSAEGVRYGLKPGEAMDLQTGWDFSKKSDQERAWKYLVEESLNCL